MARTLTEAPLTTRNARAKLGEGLHWRGIDADTHLGYRKGKRGGVWLVRWRVSGGGYHRDQLGTADDAISEGTLDYNAAIRAARERVEAARIEERATADGAPRAVATAVAAYCAGRDARDSARKGRPVRSDATHKMERYVTGREARGQRAAVEPSPLAAVMLHELEEAHLIAWRQGLPDSLKGATRQRAINDLKAALNAAYLENRARLPATLPGVVKVGLSVATGGGSASVDDGEAVARDNQILPDATVGAIIAAARDVDDARGMGGDFFRMVIVLAATGARFSQVARLTVRDLQVDRSRLMVPPSRKGKGRKPDATPVPIGADVLAALAPAIKGRGKGEPLLTRQRMEQAAGSIRWVAAGRMAWATPSELVRPWADIREAVGLDADVVPYALRHSSIVRGIRAGLPLRLVAALHDTSIAMIERHYGRWIADGLDDLAAAAVVPLVPALS
ncbi:tyrosine-type recombinase/integrase [Croceicoccus bisphenolivorans]|uniref:tyrosine-type recombinase/integrase n=1 Tax=Croceicoccus bisphenolivorans TaxID=1783232 RepID=UPI00082BB236|nr:tyrosine-type recombinase/integrase [Croceicoccus bisphenolivorans]